MLRDDLEKDLWLVFRHHELQVLAGHSREDIQQTVRNTLLAHKCEVDVEVIWGSLPNKSGS